MAETSAQISASIDALMQEFYTITHNLANVSTAGYKRRCNAFSKSLEDYPLGTQEFIPGEINIESALDLSQGSIIETGRPMDFALYGKGFFVIETPQGPLYTRNGTFFANQNGQIVDSEARVVEGQAGAITIPNNIALSDVHVASDGSISARGVAIGKFNLVDFQDDETKLVPVGSSCFQMSDDKVRPLAADNVVVKQGYQEGSNVRIVEELVDMIMVSRLYEANMKLVTANKDTSGSILSVAMG